MFALNFFFFFSNESLFSQPKTVERLKTGYEALKTAKQTECKIFKCWVTGCSLCKNKFFFFFWIPTLSEVKFRIYEIYIMRKDILLYKYKRHAFQIIFLFFNCYKAKLFGINFQIIIRFFVVSFPIYRWKQVYRAQINNIFN